MCSAQAPLEEQAGPNSGGKEVISKGSAFGAAYEQYMQMLGSFRTCFAQDLAPNSKLQPFLAVLGF